MATKKGDWYWHVHHSDSLAEREDLIGGETMASRVYYIRTQKAAFERPLRLALLTRVKNQALLNRLETRAKGSGAISPVAEKAAKAVIALHEREHPGCPAAVEKAEQALGWMPTADIFDKSRVLKTRRAWMSRRR